MKKTFLVLGLLMSNLLYSQIPDLAKRTLEGNLNENDFETRSKYMVNVDTLNWGKETISGEITWYSNKTDMLKKLQDISLVVKDKTIGSFIEIKDYSKYYYNKLHWYMVIDDYRIDWFFSNSEEPKLRSITLIKKETGT